MTSIRYSAARLAAAVLILSAASTYAQQSAQPKNADEAWSNVTSLTILPPTSKIKTQPDKVSDETKKKIKQQAAQSLQLSQTAHNFYILYPTHPKAAEARKIEAIAAVQAVNDGDDAILQSALSIASAFRENQAFPAADRLEVALAMDRLNYSLKIKGKTGKDQPQDWLKVADKLEKEFGDLAAIQAYRLEIARKADSPTANQIATNIAHSASASNAVRAEAQSILARAALIGRPLAVKLPKIRGGEIDLAQQRNQITAIVVWSPSDPASLAALKAFPNGLPQGVQIIYLAIGKVSDVLNTQSLMPVPGLSCYSPNGAAGKALGIALQLRYSPAPCVYVLDRAGKLAGYGRLKDLTALLAKALG